MGSINNLGIMRTLSLLDDMSTSRRSEGFNCKMFPLFHFRLVTVFDQLDGFTAMDLVSVDRVTAQIPDSFHYDCSAHLKVRV